MAGFGLSLKVMEEGSNKPIEGAEVTGEVFGTDNSDGVVLPVKTGPDGVAVIQGVNITVRHPDYLDYVQQPYRRPALNAAPFPVHLRRR